MEKKICLRLGKSLGNNPIFYTQDCIPNNEFLCAWGTRLLCLILGKTGSTKTPSPPVFWVHTRNLDGEGKNHFTYMLE